VFTSTFANTSIDTKCSCHGPSVPDDDISGLADEGRSHIELTQREASQSLSRARVSILVGIFMVQLVTIVLSAYGAYITGTTRVYCVKGIVFAATAMTAVFTVLAMLVAKRSLSEALLVGLVEFVFSFAVMVELDNLM
jgi:hypothetical protein